ncbi:papilin isoform X2 [Scleropages formosus]|uniref:papilin isoform X2 n=1 Tax=Scleropages formosus TaxID=113540 RepID=UPI0010FAB97E|nr:papilin-like isoform X2 [Scleropages formosus]
MILLTLAVLQLLPCLAVLVPSADYWEDWEAWGECSRSCGSGVTMRTRRCITYRNDGGNSCVGPAKSYRSCNIQDCPEGSRDFREEQCAQFDGMDFQGKRYKWLPYYRAENPCELNCIPQGESFFYRHHPAVVDGTPCYPGRRDICVDGVCKRLGCDNILESPQEEDPCLQCGGNGQSCHLVQGTFAMRNVPSGYNQMFIIPVGATTIRIREMVPTRNYLAVKNLRGEYYLNGDWVIDYSRAAPIAGTTLYYQRGAEGDMAPESITGRGPTTEPLVIELISQEENQGVEYEYYISQSRAREGYFWSYGSWSECSKDCGSGYQSRLVFCAIDNEAYPDYLCSTLPRPLSNRTCNVQPCPQTRSWKMGEWSACSAPCGGGSQTRSVQCISHEGIGSRVVEDSICASYSSQPVSQQSCNLQPCPRYSVTRWSQCSVTCGTGEQTREVTCVGAGSLRLQEYSCSGLLLPQRVQPCQMPACPLQIAWHIGDWGLCSVSCGSGLRERQVICSDKERNLYGPERCAPHPKPVTVEVCNPQSCFSPQLVPSKQDPRGYDNTLHGFRPFLPDDTTTVYWQEHGETWTSTLSDPQSRILHCSQSSYGCCPDGHTHARGSNGQGCPQNDCTQSRYGCCQDGVTAAQGHNKEGCAEYGVILGVQEYNPAPVEPSDECRSATYGCCHDGVTLASGPNGEGCRIPPMSALQPGCFLPHTAGPCSEWMSRYYYSQSAGKCVHFWYGGCHGNRNNFLSKEDCEKECHSVVRGQPRPVQVVQRRQPAHSRVRDMRRVFTVSHGGQGSSAATQAHRVEHHTRHPVENTIQHTYPTESLGVSIDKSDPSTVEGRVGQTVVLPCRVSPPPSSTVVVEWRKDGVAVPAARHQQQPNGSLLVGPLTLQDSGWLLCVATRRRERDHRYIYLSVSEGSSEMVQRPSVNQDEGHLSKVNQPSISHTPGKNSHRFSVDRSGSSAVQGRAGHAVTLPCTVTPPSATKFVSVEWTRNGRSLSSRRHTQNSDGSLSIRQLSSEDSGVYTCTASSQYHTDQRQLQLKVQGDLKITTAPNNIQVTQGGTAQLPCVVTGDNVSVGWSRNGVPVRPDGHRVQVSPDGSLILNNVQPSDEGSYTCNAYTGTYSVSASAEVRVGKGPRSGTSGSASNFTSPLCCLCTRLPSLFLLVLVLCCSCVSCDRSELGARESVSAECADQPELANCDLIVYARLCTNEYYSSFCCASCARHARA